MLEQTAPPKLQFTLALHVTIGPALELGARQPGIRRTVPITGGTFEGPSLSGIVLPGGADWQIVEPDGLTHVDAQYVIETTDGVRIEVRNQGIRHASPEIQSRIAAGDTVPCSEYYFRTSPRFFPPAGKYEWLKKSIFLGDAERYANHVIVKVWQVG